MKEIVRFKVCDGGDARVREHSLKIHEEDTWSIVTSWSHIEMNIDEHYFTLCLTSFLLLFGLLEMFGWFICFKIYLVDRLIYQS